MYASPPSASVASTTGGDLLSTATSGAGRMSRPRRVSAGGVPPGVVMAAQQQDNVNDAHIAELDGILAESMSIMRNRGTFQNNELLDGTSPRSTFRDNDGAGGLNDLGAVPQRGTFTSRDQYWEKTATATTNSPLQRDKATAEGPSRPGGGVLGTAARGASAGAGMTPTPPAARPDKDAARSPKSLMAQGLASAGEIVTQQVVPPAERPEVRETSPENFFDGADTTSWSLASPSDVSMDVFSQRPSDISDYTSTTVGAGAKSVLASAAAASTKQQRTPVGALESKTGETSGSKVPRGQVESGDDETLSPSSTRVPHDVTPEHVQQVGASGALQLRRGSAAGGGSSNYGTSPSGVPSGEGTTCSTAAAASSSQPLGRDSLDIDELCNRVRRRSFGVGPSSNHGSVPGSKRQSVTFSEGNPVGGAGGGRRGSASGGAGGDDVGVPTTAGFMSALFGGSGAGAGLMGGAAARRGSMPTSPLGPLPEDRALRLPLLGRAAAGGAGGHVGGAGTGGGSFGARSEELGPGRRIGMRDLDHVSLGSLQKGAAGNSNSNARGGPAEPVRTEQGASTSTSSTVGSPVVKSPAPPTGPSPAKGAGKSNSTSPRPHNFQRAGTTNVVVTTADSHHGKRDKEDDPQEASGEDDSGPGSKRTAMQRRSLTFGNDGSQPQAVLSDKYALGQSRSPVDFGRAGGADSAPTTNSKMTDADRKLALLKEMEAEDDDDEGDQKRGKSAKERSSSSSNNANSNTSTRTTMSMNVANRNANHGYGTSSPSRSSGAAPQHDQHPHVRREDLARTNKSDPTQNNKPENRTGGGQQSAAGEEQGGPRGGGLDGEKVVERRSFDRKKVQQQGGAVGIPTGPAIKERFRAHLDGEDARKESRVFTIEELTRQMAMDCDDPQQVDAAQPGGASLPLAALRSSSATSHAAALNMNRLMGQEGVDIAYGRTRAIMAEEADYSTRPVTEAANVQNQKDLRADMMLEQEEMNRQVTGDHLSPKMHMVPPDPESYYKLKAANKLGNAETVMQNVAPTLLADKDRLDRERGGGGAGAGGADNMKAAYRRASTDGVPSSLLRMDRESNSSADARVHSKPRSSDFISAKEKAFFYNPAASSTGGAERSSRAASKDQTKELSEGSGVAENIKQSQNNHGGGLRRKSTGGVDPKSVNQAKTQLWQLISGVMIPQGTEFSIPFNRGNGALVSAWFRKLRKIGAGSGGATSQLRWADVMNHVKQAQKNALSAHLKSQVKKFCSDTDEPAGEPASLERVFELLWPVETTKQLAQVRQWILSFELQEHNKRIKVKPPPLLPTEKVDELEAMYEYLLQGGSEGRRTVEEDELTFGEIVDARVLSEEEVARWVQQEVSAGDVITKETFIKMACPSGYRASETVTNCVSAEGKELILDPELGWIILTSG